jgi:predicted nucleic-acid-binding Zn-ribbon protein
MNVQLKHKVEHPDMIHGKEVDRMSSKAEVLLEQTFSCPRCGRKGGHAEQLAMTGAGLTRVFGFRKNDYAFVSCTNCGYTEVYNTRALDAQANLGIFLENLFGS